MAMAASGKRQSFYADLDRLRQHFDSLDAEKSGHIGLQELTKLIESIPGVEESAVPELMDRLDRDKDGKVTFEDFEVLFELEQEAVKKQRKLNTESTQQSDSDTSPYHQSITDHDASQSLEYNTALDDLPSLSEILTSPLHSSKPNSRLPSDGVLPESPKIVLRHKRLGRSTTLPTKFNPQTEFGMFSPIHSDRTPAKEDRPLSNEFPDLASQLNYLTPGGYPQALESPQLKRGSRVLSWISESEDLFFEDTGTEVHRETEDGTGSPPLSPTRGNDEASIVRSILESVCHTSDIGKESIFKLCEHVKADPQEQEELLGLLDHLDCDKKGHVSLDEFVGGLQAVRNSAAVTSTPPSVKNPSLRRTYSEQLSPPPHLSHPFSTPIASKPGPNLLASTPMTAAPSTAETSMTLSVLDPDNSGYVKMDSLVSQWHNLGVDPAQNTSLKKALSEEGISMDQAGRVNVSELTSFLEGAILSEGEKESKQTVVRQVALRTFKSEIANLRSQVHQVSLERDKIKTNLNRTLEENKKLVQEGDEHVDLVTKQSERRLKEKEERMSVRLKEVEKSRQEEALQIQDQAASAISHLRSQLETLKAEEEKMRVELRIAQEEVQDTTDKLTNAHADLRNKESTIALLQRGLGSRSELDLLDGESQLTYLKELKQELTENRAIVNDLREKLRETQDKYDLLVSDNEKTKQKYLALKRMMQRRKSTPSPTKSNATPVRKRHSTGDKPRRPNRPLSGSLYGRSRPIRPTMRPLSYDLDLAVEGTHHPVLYEEGPDPNFLEEPVSLQEKHELEAEYLEMHQDSDKEGTDSSPTPNEEVEDLLAKSTTSLMDEIQYEEQRSLLESKIKQLRHEKAQLEMSYQQLEEQIRNMEEAGLKDELYSELEKNKSKQDALENYILSLERQCESLNATRSEIDSQLANAEDFTTKQLQDIRSLRNLTNASDGKFGVLLDELDRAHSLLEEEKQNHEKSMALLKGEISKLEEYSDTQTDQCLKLEEEKAQLHEDIVSLQQSHEADVSMLSKKLDKATGALAIVKADSEEKFRKIKEQLENAQQSNVQYEEQVQALRTELAKSQVHFTSSKSQIQELEVVPISSTTSAAEIDHMRTLLEQTQEEFTSVSQMNEQLHRELEMYQLRLTTFEEKAKNDVSSLQLQLVDTQKELSDQSELYSNEISRLKEDQQEEQVRSKQRMETLLSGAQEIHLQQIETIKQQHRQEIESIYQKLMATEEQEKVLQEKLLSMADQYEESLSKIGDLTENESAFQQRITDLENNRLKQKEEISQLKVDIELVQNELKSRNREVLEEDFDSPVTPQTAQSLGQSRSFDTSMHEELITQMKTQLEELQRSLVLQSKSGGGSTVDEELALINGLIASNETLDAEIDKMKNDFVSECSKYSTSLYNKDRQIKELQSKIEKEKKAFEALTLTTASRLLATMGTFQDDSDETLTAYKSRIEAAASKLENVNEFLREKDERQTNALDKLLTDLDQSQSAIFGYRDEVERLKSELDKSVLNLSLSHEELIELQSARDREVEGLRNQLLNAEESDTTDSPVTHSQQERSPRHIVDVESGQLINSSSELEDSPTRTSTIQLKDEEIQSLRKEIEKFKRMEKQTQNANEDLARELHEKKTSLYLQESELQQRLKQIKELESQLETVISEPVEAVVQYVELQPLENLNEAVLVGLRHEAEKHLAKSESDQQKPELRDTEEDTLRGLQEAELSLRLQQQQQTINEMEAKHAAEMEELRKVIELQTSELHELYTSSVGSSVDKSVVPFTHTDLISKCGQEIEKLKLQIAEERARCLELQSTLESNIKEHDQLDAQFELEHEEEVKALHQQKDQLQRQIEEIKVNYHQVLTEQEEQNNILLQDLVNNKDDIERQLKEKTEELFHVYQQVADLMEEKKVLMDIIHQLCLEAGKQIDVV